MADSFLHKRYITAERTWLIANGFTWSCLVLNQFALSVLSMFTDGGSSGVQIVLSQAFLKQPGIEPEPSAFKSWDLPGIAKWILVVGRGSQFSLKFSNWGVTIPQHENLCLYCFKGQRGGTKKVTSLLTMLLKRLLQNNIFE